MDPRWVTGRIRWVNVGSGISPGGRSQCGSHSSLTVSVGSEKKMALEGYIAWSVLLAALAFLPFYGYLLLVGMAALLTRREPPATQHSRHRSEERPPGQAPRLRPEPAIQPPAERHAEEHRGHELRPDADESQRGGRLGSQGPLL